MAFEMSPELMQRILDQMQKGVPTSRPGTFSVSILSAADRTAMLDRVWPEMRATKTVVVKTHVEEMTSALALPEENALQQWAKRDALLATLPPHLRLALANNKLEDMTLAAQCMIWLGERVAGDMLAGMDQLITLAYNRGREDGITSTNAKKTTGGSTAVPVPPQTINDPNYTTPRKKEREMAMNFVQNNISIMADRMSLKPMMDAYGIVILPGDKVRLLAMDPNPTTNDYLSGKS